MEPGTSRSRGRQPVLDINKRPVTNDDVATSVAPAGIDVFELAAGGMVITDRAGYFRCVNPAFARLVGRERSELEGVPFSSLTSPDDVARSEALLRGLVAGKAETARLEKRYFRPDGSVVCVELHIRSLTDSNGEVAAFLVQFLDITDRKRAEEAAALDRWRLEEAQRVAEMGSFERDSGDRDLLRFGRVEPNVRTDGPGRQRPEGEGPP